MIMGAVTPLEVPIAEMESDADLSSELKEAQKKDPDIATVMTILMSEMMHKEKLEAIKRQSPQMNDGGWFRRRMNGLTIIDGRLYLLKKINQENVACLIIPKSMTKNVLNRAHGDFRSGHPGVRRTHARLDQFCDWPGMRADVNEKVSRCHECQAYQPKHMKEVPVVPIENAEFPMHFVSTDLLDMGTVSNGCDKVLVIADRYTRYLVLFPIRGKEAVTVAKKLEQFVTRFGYPVVWGSDNGTEFRNRLSEALCILYETKKEFSLAYHPQTQGMVERSNRTIIQEVSKKIENYGRQWASFLPWIEYAYNSTPHPGTHHTPYSLMFSRHPRIPTSTMLPPQPIVTQGWKNNDRQYFEDVQKRMKSWRDIRADYMKRYHETRFNTHPRIEAPYRVGDQVLVVRPKERRTKLSLHYDGPFNVRKQLPGPEGREGNVYVLDDGKGGEVVKPASDLKKFLPPIDEGIDEVPRVDSVESDEETIPAEESDESWDGLMPPDEFELLFGDDEPAFIPFDAQRAVHDISVEQDSTPAGSPTLTPSPAQSEPSMAAPEPASLALTPSGAASPANASPERPDAAAPVPAISTASVASSIAPVVRTVATSMGFFWHAGRRIFRGGSEAEAMPVAPPPLSPPPPTQPPPPASESSSLPSSPPRRPILPLFDDAIEPLEDVIRPRGHSTPRASDDEGENDEHPSAIQWESSLFTNEASIVRPPTEGVEDEQPGNLSESMEDNFETVHEDFGTQHSIHESQPSIHEPDSPILATQPAVGVLNQSDRVLGPFLDEPQLPGQAPQPSIDQPQLPEHEPQSDDTEPAEELLGAAAPLPPPPPPPPPPSGPAPTKRTLRELRNLGDHNSRGLREGENPVASRLRPRRLRGQDRERYD